MTTFKVENKDFTLHTNYQNETEYTINSVPNPYLVRMENRTDILSEIQERLNKNPKNILVVDKNIKELYFKNLDIDESRIFLVEPSEEFKTLDNGVMKLLDFLAEAAFTKKEEMIAVGGGITEDIAAFAGACFKRGIKWIFYPTTLLSMCDSCIGGKTGINYHNTKNQVALFSAPREVIININFLKTLSDFDIKSGMGEILKLLVTGGNDLLNTYEQFVTNGKINNFENYKELILPALAVKRAIIEEDEFEKYYRKSLNYGHTIGHAIEVLSNYEIPHGQAVIIGMVVVNKLAFDRGILKSTDYERVKLLSKQLLGETDFSNIQYDKLRNLLKNDKKTEGNVINFVIISEIGNTKFFQTELNEEIIEEIKTTIGTEL